MHKTKSFWEAFDKSCQVSFDQISLFAHESSVEKSFFESTLHNSFIILFKFCKLKFFYTTQNILENIWHIYSTKKTNENLLIFEGIASA